MKTDWRCHMLALLLAASTVAAADAQTGPYPSKPVQILADSSAGSTPDVALRVVADRLTQAWGQQVLVVNRPGGGGSVAARAAAEAAPDGYTLYQPVLSTFVTLHPAAPNVPLHVPKDFLPIAFISENPMFIAVSPTLGISTLPELIALAKKRPGEIPYATTGVGRLTHLTGELLQHQAGIKLLLVPYTGGPAHAVGDVTTGRVAMIIEGYSGIAGAARSGSVKLIAVASAKRLAEFPDVPTVAETIPGFPSHRLGRLGGAGRHARGDHRQGQRRRAQGRRSTGAGEEACDAWQLHEADVGRRSHGFHPQAAADVAAGPGRDCQEAEMKAASLTDRGGRSALLGVITATSIVGVRGCGRRAEVLPTVVGGYVAARGASTSG